VGALATRDIGGLRSNSFLHGFTAVEGFTSPRAWCFTLLGIHEFQRRFPRRGHHECPARVLVGRLLDLWEEYSTEHWPWFEASLTLTTPAFARYSFNAARRCRTKRRW